MHPLWEIGNHLNSDVEKVAFIAIAQLSTKEPYSTMTPEQVYDAVLELAKECITV